jgi:threonine dehydrogenase-like Zn-dependent dehydrogenase
MVFGIAPQKARIALAPFRIYNDKITLLSSMAVLHAFEEALHLLNSGVIMTNVLLTQALSLEHFLQALTLAHYGGCFFQ